VKYPDFDRAKYTDKIFPKALVWHWLLNPILAFNELIMGQRIPVVMLLDKTSKEPRYLRTYVPCPHCGSIHRSMLWGKGNALGHWYGCLCPNCDQIIPCLRNWTSRAILTITYPLWILPSRMLKPRWLAHEKVRLNRVLAKPPVVIKPAQLYKRALLGGIVWGLLMWLAMDLIPFLHKAWADTSPTINIGPLVYGLPILLVLGLVWGLLMGGFMQFFILRKGKKISVSSSDTK
jgi:hypothetical protein